MDPLSARRYVERPWREMERLRAEHWAERCARHGPADLVRVADLLWREARALRPDWPTSADRDADLLAHEELAALFRRAHTRRG